MILPDRTINGADVAHHYDALDRIYRAVWGEHLHHGLWLTGRETVAVAVRQLVDLVAAAAEIGPGDDVLDIGSGYGAAARQIAADYGARVIGITLSPVQHERATGHPYTRGGARFLLGDWMENDLPDESFDVVYAIECASHMPDRTRFVEQAVRVLRPGGRLILCVWAAAEHARPAEVRWLLEPICREGRLAHLSTAGEYIALLEEAGMVLTGFRDLSRHVRRTWSTAIRRTAARLLTDPHFLRYLANPRNTERRFLLTIVRLWLAYRTGAMRYCLLKAGRNRARDISAKLA